MKKFVWLSSGYWHFDLTLPPAIKPENLTVVAELKFESANDEIYFDKDDGPTKSNFSGILAAAWHF